MNNAPRQKKARERPTASPYQSLGPDVTPPPSTTPTPSLQPLFTELLSDQDFDHISDSEELIEDYLYSTGEPLAVRRRAMAADFSEGRLETFVGSPMKELAGTQNQYVSYQVTTKVSKSPQPVYHSNASS